MGLSIDRVFAWEALDSRGSPTVACSVALENGAEGQALAPSGASTGTHEALERRDGGERLDGRGVRAAVATVNDEIGPDLRGRDPFDQAAIDARLCELDGTPNLSRLGTNAVLATSVATAIAAASARAQPLWKYLADGEAPMLPLPMVNVVSGGAHAGRMIDIQDVLAIPVGATSFSAAIEWAIRVRSATAEVLRDLGVAVELVADEGGFSGALPSNEFAVGVVAEAIARAGLSPGDQVAIGVDVAATQFHDGSEYNLACERRRLDAAGMVAEVRSWCDRHPIVSVEDPLGEDDSEGWLLASSALSRVQLLGDDLFATSVERLATGIQHGVANAVIVKPNQAGTLSGAKRVVELARSAGYATVLSARSGETEEAWLADVAVGWRTGQLKVGSATRSERTAKWNRLLRLEAEYPDLEFARCRFLAPL